MWLCWCRDGVSGMPWCTAIPLPSRLLSPCEYTEFLSGSALAPRIGASGPSLRLRFPDSLRGGAGEERIGEVRDEGDQLREVFGMVFG